MIQFEPHSEKMASPLKRPLLKGGKLSSVITLRKTGILGLRFGRPCIVV